ncbi:MAG: hypothetical protein D6695_08340 [Planctomycetota bacterium]|nr:MAG: hypothetical protein D6695_08340 [Planctomycetota bacterium]
MKVRPKITELVGVGLATVWSFSLMLAGLWSAVVGSGRWPAFSTALWAAGIAAIAAGHVVFLACVAERIFPNANRNIVLWMEMVSCATFVAASIVCLYALFPWSLRPG